MWSNSLNRDLFNLHNAASATAASVLVRSYCSNFLSILLEIFSAHVTPLLLQTMLQTYDETQHSVAHFFHLYLGDCSVLVHIDPPQSFKQMRSVLWYGSAKLYLTGGL